MGCLKVIYLYQNLDSRLLAKEVIEQCLKEIDPAFILSFVLNTASPFKSLISHRLIIQIDLKTVTAK